MALRRDYVLEALLGVNYFPNQRSSPPELPSVISSKSFTPEVARELAALPVRAVPGYNGYDAVEFQAFRFDGRSRRFSIPHPMAHARLCLCIHEHWRDIGYITSNKNSRLRPKRHPDGRLLAMDYGNWRLETRARLTHALLRRYVVNADVAQCFPSIYTHAIAWATVGISNAKQSVGKNTWFNRLDQCVMMQKRNETSGILVGPGTSNIVVELILSPIDDEIRKNGFLFDRYIDDYSAYVDSLDRADEFISLLSQELFRYKLSLNDAKSMVKELPEALIERAIVELSNLCPKSDSVGFYEASRYLDFAVTVAKANPSVSALKYALKSLLARGISDNAISDFFLYFLMLAYRQPTLLPLLEMLPRRNLLIGIGAHEETLNRLLLVYAKSGKADAVVWAIYFLTMASLSIRNDSAKAILDSQDCLSLTLLYRFGSREQKDAVVTLAKSTVQQDLYIRDQYWVLLYEIYREKRIGNPYHRAPKDQAFKVMRDKGIHFIESQALGL